MCEKSFVVLPSAHAFFCARCAVETKKRSCRNSAQQGCRQNALPSNVTERDVKRCMELDASPRQRRELLNDCEVKLQQLALSNAESIRTQVGGASEHARDKRTPTHHRCY